MAASESTSGKGKTAIKNVSLNWTDNSNGADNDDVFAIERCQESGKGRNRICSFSELMTLEQDATSFSKSPGSGTFVPVRDDV